MIGRTVSHYRITGKLGEGGMGVVYRAEDTDLGRTVALKFLSPELTRDPAAKERFRVEAQAASRLDHPNICTIYEIGETTDARLFISMACYDGDTLAHRLEDGPFPPEEAVGIAVDVAAGLSAAHAEGMVHRDIKPGNVLVTGRGRAKILDFGLAKLGEPSDLTRAGVRLGTVAYMSPEQARGHTADSRTDIWSLGVLLYELLTGRRPFQGESSESVMYAICNEPVAPPSTHVPALPPELDAVIVRCLEKTASRRYGSADELQTALERVAELLPKRRDRSQLDTTPVPAVGSRTRGLRALATIVLPVVVVLVAAAAFFGLHSRGREILGVGRIAPPPETRTIAVLPFKGTDEKYARGFRDYFVERLQEMEQFTTGFRVVPAADVDDLKITRPESAAPILGANTAVLGTLSSGDDSVRVHLELRASPSGDNIREWTVVEQPANVAALQDIPTRFIAEALGIELSGRARRRSTACGTTVPTAFVAYLRGTGALDAVRDGNSADSTDAAAATRAALLLTEATTADPAFALAHAALGRALWRRCELERDFRCGGAAESSLLRALDLDERCTQALVAEAGLLVHAGRYDDAAALLRDALEVDPMSIVARQALADLRAESGQTALAETAHREVIELRSEYWRGHDALGVFLSSQGRYDEAAAEFASVTQIAPGNAHAYRNLGAMYYYLDRLDDAAETFERAVELSPDYTTYSNLATLHFARARYADAAAMYERALAIDDSDYRVWGNLGSSYLWVPNGGARAQAAYREAAARGEQQRALTPRDPLLLTSLAAYYAELDEPGRARTLLEEALLHAPGDVEVMFQVGHTHEVLGDRELALSWIEMALEHGYPRAQVESTPALRGLCADERYQAFAEQTDGREYGL